MKRSVFLMFLIVTMSSLIPLAAAEQIVNFKIERDIFGEQNWFLLDKDGNSDYGFFNCRTESNYIGYNTILTTYFITDKSEEPYYGRVEPKKFGEMVIANTRFRSNMFWTVFSAGFAAAFIIPGAVLMAIGYPYIDYGNPSYGAGSEAIFYAGVVCMVLGVTMAITFLVFMPMMIFYYVKYKRMQTKILDVLNGRIRAGKNGPTIKLALDLRM